MGENENLFIAFNNSLAEANTGTLHFTLEI